jgi:DMSO reductase anchor subunit
MPVYALLCLWSGLLALWLIGALGGVSAPAALLPTLIVLTFAALALKAIYWRHIDRTGSPGSTGAATGLGYLGTVRAFEAPHTESNYLLREMGFRLARKHASRLRSLTILLLAAICVAVGAAWAWPRSATSFALLCFALAAAALFVERWLFFAQAQHLVTHYYGRSAA